MTDELRALSDRLAKGDRGALEILFTRFAGSALAAAVRVLRSRSEAEEVVQDTFLEVWRRAMHYQPERSAFETWLVTIARSRAIDRLRTRDAQARAAKGVEVHEPEHQPTADELLQKGRLVQWLQRSMLRLPPDQRETLELAYREGLTQAEIAKRTGTPLGTVKTRMRLATRKLHELLGVDGAAAAAGS
jgi:RNA polymerase sigma-70 factor (ECF subfamily)